MPSPSSSLDARSVVELARLAGLSLGEEDAEALAAALTAHTKMVEPLFEADLEDLPAAPTYDPRWRGSHGSA